MRRRDISKVKVGSDSAMKMVGFRTEVKIELFTRLSVAKKVAVIDPFFWQSSEISVVEEGFQREFFQKYSYTDMPPAG